MLTTPTHSFSLHARFHELIKFFVCGIDHHGRAVEQGDFVLGLDLSDFVHQLLAVDDFDALSLQSEQHRYFNHVDADRLVLQVARFQFQLDFLRDIFGQTGAGVGRPAQGGNPCPRALAQPRAVDLMMTRRRAEIPEDRLVILRQQGKAHQLVHRPGADMRGGDVANVVHVEAEQRAQLGLLQRALHPRQPLMAKTLDIDAFFPIDGHQAESF